MTIPTHLIDLARVDEVNLAGRGGHENNVSALLPNWVRVNAPLHDYEIENQGNKVRLEIKKQEDLQWFDSGKYYNLNPQDRDIIILFLIHKKGEIKCIAMTYLGDFLDWLFDNRASDGWNEEVLRVGADFKKKFPSLQFKAQVHVAKTIKIAPNIFNVIYQRK